MHYINSLAKIMTMDDSHWMVKSTSGLLTDEYSVTKLWDICYEECTGS